MNVPPIVIVIIVVGLLASVLVSRFLKNNSTSIPNMEIIMYHAIAWALSTVLVFVIHWMLSSSLPKDKVVHSKMKIVSMRDKDITSGSFTIGTVSINQIEYYTFYQQLGDGYKKGKVEVEKSIILEEDREDAELVTKKEVFQSDWMRNHFKPIGDKMTSYEFLVPKGTLVKRFLVE